jgi:hypothetical protein
MSQKPLKDAVKSEVNTFEFTIGGETSLPIVEATPQEPNQNSSRKRVNPWLAPGRHATVEEAAAMASAGAQAIEMTSDAVDFFGDVVANGSTDEISDDEARRRAQIPEETLRIGGIRQRLARLPRPTQPGTDLVVQNFQNALIEAKESPFEPKWMKVRQLPAYLLSQIRRLGRDVFTELGTTVPLEEVQIISTLTHPATDVQKMAYLISNYGQKMREQTNIFGNVSCDVQIWRFANYDWVVVEDFGGNYIYGWPENPAIEPQVKPKKTNPHLRHTPSLPGPKG